MIKAKDLRIDNWAYGSIRPTNEPKQIKDITLNICKLGEYLEGYESINPIPLTAEILLKCGFEKRKDGYYILALNHARMSIGFYAGVPDKMTLFQMQGLPYDDAQEFKMHFGVNHPSYLHQLQNLYYALTQTELEVKL